MTNHLTEDELILHCYGEIERDEQSRVDAHLAACEECQVAKEKLVRVMTMIDTAAPVEAPAGFERVVWARLEPQLEANKKTSTLRALFWFPQWALAGGVAALLVAAFWAGRMSSSDPARLSPAAQTAVADVEPSSVLRTAVGDHLDRTQMMLVELANAETDKADVLAGEQQRAADLVAANRVIRASAQQSGDAAIVDILDDLERVLMEIANAPATASSNELNDLQSQITAQDLLFRLRVVAQEMRQRNQLDRATSDRRQPIS